MSMILDHINGVHDDNRIENLRIICPNCAATLDTHCGRKNGGVPRRPRLAGHPRECATCQRTFTAVSRNQRYCSQACWFEEQRRRGIELLGRPQPHLRKVERPPREQLIREIDELGYLAVGRKYGVSDTAIRKWVRQYEREQAIAEGGIRPSSRSHAARGRTGGATGMPRSAVNLGCRRGPFEPRHAPPTPTIPR